MFELIGTVSTWVFLVILVVLGMCGVAIIVTGTLVTIKDIWKGRW